MARVLLIEDDADIRLMYRFALERAGHDVTTAATGAEGLRVAIAERPHCVVIDVGLPDLDGYEVATHIRSNDPGRAIGIIGVTGYADDEHRERGRIAGFDVHLVKPVEPHVLILALGRFAR